VWEQGDEIWDGEAGNFPYSLDVLSPNMASFPKTLKKSFSLSLSHARAFWVP
jgi:hypothetical protein